VGAAATGKAGKTAPANGNAAGVATVHNDSAVAAKALESKFYTLKPGDTLWRSPKPNMAPATAANII
jgi:hypothetical protein